MAEAGERQERQVVPLSGGRAVGERGGEAGVELAVAEVAVMRGAVPPER